MMRTVGISMAALLAVAACDSGDNVSDLRTYDDTDTAQTESPYMNDTVSPSDDGTTGADRMASAPMNSADEPGMMGTDGMSDETDTYGDDTADTGEVRGQNDMAMTEEPAAGVWTFKDENDVAWAGFGPVGSEPQFSMTCEFAQGDISQDSALVIRRVGQLDHEASADLTILTNEGSAEVAMEPMEGNISAMEGRLPMTDPFVERLKQTDGQVTVETGGGDRLVMPAGDAIAQVIEACSAS